MNAILLIVLLELTPGGTVFTIEKTANVSSLEYCEYLMDYYERYHRENFDRTLTLISVSCREYIST